MITLQIISKSSQFLIYSKKIRVQINLLLNKLISGFKNHSPFSKSCTTCTSFLFIISNFFFLFTKIKIHDETYTKASLTPWLKYFIIQFLRGVFFFFEKSTRLLVYQLLLKSEFHKLWIFLLSLIFRSFHHSWIIFKGYFYQTNILRSEDYST